MQDIANAIAAGRCVLFAGAGTSFDAGLPDWSGLVDRLKDILATKGRLSAVESEVVTTMLSSNMGLGAVLQFLQSAVGRRDLVITLRDILKPTGPSQVTKALASLGFAGTVTTNYDRVINAPTCRISYGRSL